MPPRGGRRGPPRKQYQRGEEVFVVGDANNPAFKATASNSRKRSIQPQRSIEHDAIEIVSDDEPSQPPRKSRPNPRISAARIRAANQVGSSNASRQGSEESISQEVIACPMEKPSRLFYPFAEMEADVYIVFGQKDLKHTYRIKSDILIHASSWFRSQLKGAVYEVDPDIARVLTKNTGIKYRFEYLLDDDLGYYILKRMGLTMYKKQDQEVVTKAISAVGHNRQSFHSNGANHSRRSSLAMTQYDGSFDDVEMEDMDGGFNAALHFDIPGLPSSPGMFQPSFDNLINGHQGADNRIKLEEEASARLDDAEFDPSTQRNTMEKVATPPSSPPKTGTENVTDHTMSESVQFSTASETLPAEQGMTPLETQIKAEVETESKMFPQNLPIAQTSPESRPVNAGENVDTQHHTESCSNQMPLSRQVLPGEELQITTSIETPKPELKIEEAQQVASVFSQVPQDGEFPPATQIDPILDPDFMMTEPQERAGQIAQTPSADVSCPDTQIGTPAATDSKLVEAQLASRLSPQKSPGAQELPQEPMSEQLEVHTNGKLEAGGEQQAKLDFNFAEPSSNSQIVTKTVSPNSEKPNNTPIQTPARQPVKIQPVDQLNAYHSLFLCYYNFPPNISATNMEIALKQSDTLIKIANMYDTSHIVRPHIIGALLSHGRNLYSAIRHDPPRLLSLATKLHSAPMFKEALIHIVGQYPSWPWPTPQDRLSALLNGFIDKKVAALKEKKSKANEGLFKDCLFAKGVRISINNLDKSTFDIWIIVQIWHDWFSQQLHKCARTRHHENRSIEGNMYRLLAQGGDAYLKTDDVMAMVKPYQAGSAPREWGNWERGSVEQQLNIMKEFAKKKVAGLAVNELMGDADDVEYLTCTRVEEYELPWVAVTRIDEDEGEGEN